MTSYQRDNFFYRYVDHAARSNLEAIERTIACQWCIGTCPAGHAGTGWLERAAETRRGREHAGRAGSARQGSETGEAAGG